MNSRLRSPKKLAPDPDIDIAVQYQHVSQALTFCSDLFQTTIRHEINKPLNQPNVTGLDTSIVNEAKQIICEMKDYPKQVSKCLGQRAAKLIRLIEATGMSDSASLILVNQKKYRSVSPYLQLDSKDCSVDDTALSNIKKLTTPISYSRKTEADPYTPTAMKKTMLTENTKQSYINVEVQTQPNVIQQKASNDDNQLEDEPRPEPTPVQLMCFKQNCSLTINQTIIEEKRKPRLAFSPSGFINIHEVLRARRDSRSHDSDNMLKMEQFKNKIEQDIEAINRELDSIKNKKTRVKSAEDEEIQALEAQIQSLNRPISVRLDISEHIDIQKSSKTPKSRSPIRVTSFTIDGNRLKPLTPTRVTCKQTTKSPLRIQLPKPVSKKLLTTRMNHLKK